MPRNGRLDNAPQRAAFARYVEAAGGVREAARRLERSPSSIQKLLGGYRGFTLPFAARVERDARRLNRGNRRARVVVRAVDLISWR